MSTSSQALIDRVASNTGLHLPALAERLGMRLQSLEKIRKGHNPMKDGVKKHLLDIERAEMLDAKFAKPLGKNGPMSRARDEPAHYKAGVSEDVFGLVISRIISKATVKDLAELISEIASDDELTAAIRTRVVKILSELIPGRMK